MTCTPSRRAVRAMRQAISPRLAMRSLRNMSLDERQRPRADPGPGARVYALAGIVRLSDNYYAGVWEGATMSEFDACDFDFGLGPTVAEVRDAVRRFAREEIAPLAQRIDRSN